MSRPKVHPLEEWLRQFCPSLFTAFTGINYQSCEKLCDIYSDRLEELIKNFVDLDTSIVQEKIQRLETEKQSLLAELQPFN